MTKEEFNRELRFQIIMYFAKRMLFDRIISVDDYYLINTRNLKKYRPVTCDLLSGRFLLAKSIGERNRKFIK